MKSLQNEKRDRLHLHTAAPYFHIACNVLRICCTLQAEECDTKYSAGILTARRSFQEGLFSAHPEQEK